MQAATSSSSREKQLPLHCLTANIQPGVRMANYIARVELHLAGPEDYERLHLTMQQRGYLRKIAGEDGVVYQLPAGTYFVSNTSAMLSVALRAAVEAANETGKESAVLVTDWQAARWNGLAKG
jgi:hypothetical protein